jgi:hypothetical protein
VGRWWDRRIRWWRRLRNGYSHCRSCFARSHSRRRWCVGRIRRRRRSVDRVVGHFRARLVRRIVNAAWVVRRIIDAAWLVRRIIDADWLVWRIIDAAWFVLWHLGRRCVDRVHRNLRRRCVDWSFLAWCGSWRRGSMNWVLRDFGGRVDWIVWDL